jgi:integrase
MLYDQTGNRKYLTSKERQAFILVALEAEGDIGTFAMTLAYSGARISEVLATTARRIDFSAEGIVFRTLKRRRPDIYRMVPLPPLLLEKLEQVHNVRAKQLDPSLSDRRMWPWCRTTAWQRVKFVMQKAGIAGVRATPKGLRHGFGVEGTAVAGVPLNMMQRWLGHARIETTAIYATAIGPEERALAARTWKGLPT